MFGIDSGELLIIAIVALVIIGPKDLPRVMRSIGNFVGRARGMARHFRTGVDAMMREAELEDMDRQWKAHNEKIMRDHPYVEPVDSDWGTAAPASQPGPAALPPADGDALPPLATAAPEPPQPPRRAAPRKASSGRLPPPPPPRGRRLP